MFPNTRPMRMLVWAALMAGLAGCEKGAAPTAPQPPTPTPRPSPAGMTISGVVLEFSAPGEYRPAPNLRLKVRTNGALTGATASEELPDVVTDAEGRYTVTDITATMLFFQTAPGADQRFLCDGWPVDLRRPQRITDLPVVPTSWSGNGPPHWTVGSSVWGTVYERVEGRPQPIADASVNLDGTEPPAVTSTNGFYMICSMVGSDFPRTVAAWKNGYDVGSREFRSGWDFELNLELTRR